MAEELKEGKCVIFSAPSGAGKTTIVHHLLEVMPELEFSVSATSRPKREFEKDGEDYYFLSNEEFKEHIDNHDFIEWEEVYENTFYGTLRSEIQRIWNDNKTVIFDVDVVGGLNLKNSFEEQALAVFVMPPSMEVLERRLRSRGTEDAASLERRIGKATREIEFYSQFDRVLVNDDLSKACAEAERLIKNFL